MTQQKRSMNPLALILILSSVFFVFFLIISGVIFLYKAPASGRTTTGSSSFFSAGNGSVGVIELNGVITDSKKVLARLETFEDDESIKAVVVRINSPGGSVAPSQEIYEAVKKYKKPIISSMASVAASGAYYVACGTQKIFANPGTMTGSIGVIMEFANLHKLYDWAKIQRFSIKTGKFKDSGAEYREMSDEERAVLQRMIDDVLVQFKQAVATGRKLTLAQVTELADGRIFSGNQAKQVHLVDELGTLQNAIEEAAKLGHIKGKPTVVYIEKPKRGLLDLLMDDSPTSEGSRSGVPGLSSLVLELVARLSGRSSPSSLTSGEGPSFSPGIYWIWGGAPLSIYE